VATLKELISVHGLLSSFGPDGQHRGPERNQSR